MKHYSMCSCHAYQIHDVHKMNTKSRILKKNTNKTKWNSHTADTHTHAHICLSLSLVRMENKQLSKYGKIWNNDNVNRKLPTSIDGNDLNSISKWQNLISYCRDVLTAKVWKKASLYMHLFWFVCRYNWYQFKDDNSCTLIHFFLVVEMILLDSSTIKIIYTLN